MGLDIYFLEEDGSEVGIESNLKITHNLNKILLMLDKIIDSNSYMLVWRPDELYNCDNGKVRVNDVLLFLPDVISNVVFYQNRLKEHLPENGYGSFEWLYKFYQPDLSCGCSTCGCLYSKQCLFR